MKNISDLRETDYPGGHTTTSLFSDFPRARKRRRFSDAIQDEVDAREERHERIERERRCHETEQRILGELKDGAKGTVDGE